MYRRLFAGLLAAFLLWTGAALGHPGRTDSNGGHRDNKNKSGLGYYHYHCGGYPPHLHKDGVCPYKRPKATAEPQVVYNEPAEQQSKSENNIRFRMIGAMMLVIGGGVLYLKCSERKK